MWAIAEGRGAAAKVDQFLIQDEALLETGDEDGRVVSYPRGIELAKEAAEEVNYSSTLISEYAG